MMAPCEQITAIIFSEQDRLATVQTCSPALQRTLMKMFRGNSDVYYFGKVGAPMTFFVDKKYLLGGLPND